MRRAIFDSSLYCLSGGSLGWERINWRGSKIRESQKRQGEDAWAGVCAHAHKGSKQWHAQTLRTPQVVFTHQGTGPVGMCLRCTFCHCQVSIIPIILKIYHKKDDLKTVSNCVCLIVTWLNFGMRKASAVFLLPLWLHKKCVLPHKPFWKLPFCGVKSTTMALPC